MKEKGMKGNSERKCSMYIREAEESKQISNVGEKERGKARAP